MAKDMYMQLLTDEDFQTMQRRLFEVTRKQDYCCAVDNVLMNISDVVILGSKNSQ